MAIIQALFGLIAKSAGKILNAIFGWAVHALFGRTSSRDQTMLSALVGAAVAWPLLVAGVVAPKVAAFALAFVSLPQWIPSWAVRLVWLTLALAVPIVLGLVLASRRPAEAPREPFVKRFLRGFPLTLGLAIAFILMFVSVPLMRLAALVRRQKSADIPLITDTAAYHDVAATVVSALRRHGLDVAAAQPGWWVEAPMRVLSFFGGDAFSAFVPKHIEHVEGNGLALSFYTSGVLLRGKGRALALAHGLVEETVIRTRGLQTSTSRAQELEREVRRVWSVFKEAPAPHTDSSLLLSRVAEMGRDLSRLDVEHEEWQVLYRQLLQLERTLRGGRQLLDETLSEPPEDRSDGGKQRRVETRRTPEAPARDLSTPQLVKEIAHQTSHLIQAQIDLAKTELRAQVSRGKTMAVGLGVAAIAALAALTTLFVTAVFALTAVMPGWKAGMLVSGGLLAAAAVAGGIAWRHRLREPFTRARHELGEDVKWIKEELA